MEYGFLLLLFLISALYASVGHGGASGYLALMAIYQFAPEVMKPSALVLNLFVAGIAFIQFYLRGYFRFKLFLPFALASIPMAFLGGTIQLDPTWYKRILGILLIFAVLRLVGVFGDQSNTDRELKMWQGLIFGGVIGFFSGLIGIGGGIILSPVILLLGWGNLKETAAVSALFIWINSLAGLLGMMSSGNFITFNLWPYIVVAIAGGSLGAYLGSYKWNYQVLRYCLSFVLAMASIKLIFI
ncbi:MAG: putative membrane protein YfcA [Cyclobacteriaceae bacterium]|jgi:uncharacterized membrane protein YfcA